MTYPKGKTIISQLAFEMDKAWWGMDPTKREDIWAKTQAYKQTKMYRQDFVLQPNIIIITISSNHTPVRFISNYVLVLIGYVFIL